MALSHSAFVPKLPCGTEPHGTAHIRSSFGHLTLQAQSAEAVEAEASREHATSRSADRIVTYPPRGLKPTRSQRPTVVPSCALQRRSQPRGVGGTMKR